MARVRRFHYRRGFDVIVGSAINAAKVKIQALALKRQLEIGKSRVEFNTFMRQNSPTVYFVDPEVVAQESINALVAKPLLYLSSIHSPTAGVTIFQDDNTDNKEFIETVEELKKEITGQYSTLAAAIKTALEIQVPTISFKVIQEQIAGIHDAAIKEFESATKNSKKYVSYKVAASRAGAELRRILNTYKLRILTDAEAYFTNIGKRIPFLSYSFSTAVSDINSIIQEQLVIFLNSSSFKPVLSEKNTKNKRGTDVRTVNFKVGEVVNAGHVGLYSKASDPNSFLGINTPGSAIAGIASSKFDDIEQAIGKLEYHVQYGMTFNPEYTSTAGIFLDMQFNFAVSMPASINVGKLAPAETKVFRDHAINLLEDAFETEMSKQLASGVVVEMIPELSASPNIPEYLANTIMSIFKGKTPSDVRSKNSVSKDLDVKSKKVNTSKTVKKTTVPSSKKSSSSRIRTTPGRFTSLASLQTLLNLALAQQIQRNMGTGTSKNILNYRSGRLAESAEVTSMSQSREGMITAFYTYMRNPYGTFSEGGAQSSPPSRDPKLLISKSIREVLATQVNNRLRAVLA